MPSKLRNEAARRSPKNFSIEDRVFDLISEDAVNKSMSRSDMVNSILKQYYGIIN